MVTKRLDSNTKHPKVLLYYDFVNGIIDEEEDMLLVAELDLFTISTIILPKLKILVVVVPNTKININSKIDTKELIFYFPHTLRKISIDITPTQIKV